MLRKLRQREIMVFLFKRSFISRWKQYCREATPLLESKEWSLGKLTFWLINVTNSCVLVKNEFLQTSTYFNLSKGNAKSVKRLSRRFFQDTFDKILHFLASTFPRINLPFSSISRRLWFNLDYTIWMICFCVLHQIIFLQILLTMFVFVYCNII